MPRLACLFVVSLLASCVPSSGAPDGGVAPAIVHLSGDATGIVPGMTSWHEERWLYLPHGWSAGADAWLDFAPLTFAADGSASPACGLPSCTLTLDPSDHCAHFVYDHSEHAVGDQLFTITGTLVACDDGTAAPGPTTTPAGSTPGGDDHAVGAPLPGSHVVVAGAQPFDVASAAAAVLRVDGLDVHATVHATPETVVLVPPAPLRFGARVEVALDGVVDVMGRVLPTPAPLTVVSTTAVATDLTFDALPPDGAVATNGATMQAMSGALCVGGGYPPCYGVGAQPLGIALALGDPGGATAATVTETPIVAEGVPPVTMQAARADGTTGTPVVALPHGAPSEVPLPPGAGAVWLLVYSADTRGLYCPTFSSAPPAVCIDSIVLH